MQETGKGFLCLVVFGGVCLIDVTLCFGGADEDTSASKTDRDRTRIQCTKVQF